MKLLYLANIRLPTEKAHGAQIMKMCEAFAELGHEVELAATNRKTSIAEDPFAYYGVKTRFLITRLAVRDTVGWGVFGFIFESLSFARSARRLLAARRPDVVYGRDELVLARLGSRIPLVWETHTGSWNRAAQKVARRAQRIVAISQGLKNFYMARGVPAEKILVAHDGIDMEAFAHPESQDSARARLGLSSDKKIVLYAGRLDGWKGSETALEASNLLPENIVVAIIGGEPRQIDELRARHPKTIFLGYRPYRELAGNLAAADLLLLPNTGKDEVSARFTSPLKLFAYMAAGKPIVASDLPSVREVLGENEAYFFTPDDAANLAAVICTAVNDPAAEDKGQVVQKKSAHYSWKVRAEHIVKALDAVL